MFSEVEIEVLLGLEGRELTEAEGSWFLEHQVMIIDSYPFQTFPQPSVDPVWFFAKCKQPDFLAKESI